MNTYTRTIAAGLCAILLVSPVRAVSFSGSHHDITDFANGSEVSARGTLIDAINLSNDNSNPTTDTVINGVLFKSVAPGQFHEAGEDFANASFVYHGGGGYVHPNLWTSGGAYDTLADSQIFNFDNPDSNTGDGYGVVNLAPGTLYQLQVFMLEDRSGFDKTFPLQFQQVKWAGSADNIDNSSPATEIAYMQGITIGPGNQPTQANGEIATVYFTIDAGYNGLLVNTWNDGAFNGMQLRQIGLPADYDGNGSVGLEDYVAWRENYGSTSNSNADGNLDGTVDIADYVTWRAQVAASASALNSAAVPEPSTGLIGAVALALMGTTVARRRRALG